jgi:Protein of unknown function (DUF4058)
MIKAAGVTYSEVILQPTDPSHPTTIFDNHHQAQSVPLLLLDVWPISLRGGIPLIPVPLRQPDPDIVLDLGSALRQTYQNGRYERHLNYRIDPPPPLELTRDDSSFQRDTKPL